MNTLFGKNKPFPIAETLKTLINAIRAGGGRSIAVGGCVRDHLLGFSPKDIDIEVYGLKIEKLEQILRSCGSVYAVGRSFGILKVTVPGPDSKVFDVSLPRTENKQGQGHKGFVVATDPNLSFTIASSRRDFTVNAMGIDLETQEVLDPHGGLLDLEQGILRHVSDAFDEDPLRVLRACQFVSRFQLMIDENTIEKCKNLKAELSTLPHERIFEEMKKLLLAKTPSKGLAALRQTEALSLFPELEGLIDCPQDPIWHPEGDVWTHTLMVVDQASILARREHLDINESLIIIAGALCHDLGKPSTTAFEDGRVRSKGHESAGEIPTQHLLARMGMPKDMVDAVVPLVRDHLKPCQLYKVRNEISDSTIRRLASRVSIARLCLVAEADFLGRTTEDALSGFDASTTWLKSEANRLSVTNEGPTAILMGRHLIDLGMEPGPKMGAVLHAAYEAQLDGEFSTLEDALAWYEKTKA